MGKVYDVAVLGATPAGYVAALTLASRGRDVALVIAPASRTESPLADWIPADLLDVCPPLRAVKSATDGPFRAVVFHSPRMDRQAAYRHRGHAGYLLQTERLRAALAEQARRRGVRTLRCSRPPALEPEETFVVLGLEDGGRSTSGRTDRRELRAALLLIAQDRPEEVVSRLTLPVRSVPTGKLTAWGLDVPLAVRPRRGLDAELHVVASTRGERLGVYFLSRRRLHVRIIFTDPVGVSGPEALGGFVSTLQDAGLVPARLDLRKAAAAMWRPPAGVALELETHLAKRTLLVGTAGGFASALSGQTLDPSIRSALVAAEVAERALGAADVQEVLSQYKNQWRRLLADRIRPPGTSLSMLLPMVLTNRAITRKFARAFLYGESM